MGIQLERLLFDPADMADSANIGSYLRSSDGTLLTHTDVSGKKALDVNIANSDFDIRDLSHTQDSIKVGDGTDFLAINGDGSINAVVTATDLDIRNLSSGTDSVTVLATDLDIRNLSSGSDSVTAVATDFDIRDLSSASDSVAAVQSGAWSVMTGAQSSSLASTVTVGATAVALPSSSLANRRKIVIQNNSSNPIYVGGSGVTTSTGIVVAKGASYSEEAGPSCALYAIAAGAGNEVRVLELA
jgi:hypothetical protein